MELFRSLWSIIKKQIKKKNYYRAVFQKKKIYIFQRKTRAKCAYYILQKGVRHATILFDGGWKTEDNLHPYKYKHINKNNSRSRISFFCELDYFFFFYIPILHCIFFGMSPPWLDSCYRYNDTNFAYIKRAKICR